MLRLTLIATLMLSTVAQAEDAKPQPQGMPAECQKNVIILSILDSRFISARDAPLLADELCKQIVAKAAQQPPAKH